MNTVTTAMIRNIKIRNYKSIVDLSLPLGTFNLLIGANGCGKSNILESIAMASAASIDKLDYEFFANRGIRTSDPDLMLPAFDDVQPDCISVVAQDETDSNMSFTMHYDRSQKPARWVDREAGKYQMMELLKSGRSISDFTLPDNSNVRVSFADGNITITRIAPDFSGFVIYSLEESKLRQADNANRLFPLGRHGEGLFAYLKELASHEDGVAIINEIKENLTVFDWFEDIAVPGGQLSNEFNVSLRDGYLRDTLNAFDQRSTNEGFLYLLFYLTLIISDETPRFFAIENIDTAFNPKLCREVTRRLVELAQKHGKQIIATTHNAAVLDGLNLKDETTRLIMVRRNVDGHTKANPVTLTDDMTISLSEAWTKGYLGGLPDNF